LIISAVMYAIVTYQKYKDKMQKDLLKVQQQLLRSQMNPHFVFNSLLAIQSFILNNDAKAAGHYLSNFSKLIRLILHSSRQEYILLSKEIEYIKYFLDLQQLRFDNKCEYQINLGTDIVPENIAIPPMLAQPFIENAIEHGLKHSKRKGVVKISFSKHDGSILFIIEDNGIGVSKAKMQDAESINLHEPLGTAITKDRLDLINRKQGQKISLEINEITDGSGNAQGTKVSFNIKFTDVRAISSD